MTNTQNTRPQQPDTAMSGRGTTREPSPAPVSAMTDIVRQERRAILRARARKMAGETKQVANAQHLIDIVEFQLATETYGIDSTFVREVVPLKDLTPLPGVPSFVLGIVSVRGQILSVIDLKKFFNLPEKGLGQLNTLIILQHKAMVFGILADQMVGVFSIAEYLIQDAPPTVAGIGAEYLRGVTADYVIILDAERILGDENIIVNQKVE